MSDSRFEPGQIVRRTNQPDQLLTVRRTRSDGRVACTEVTGGAVAVRTYTSDELRIPRTEPVQSKDHS